MEYSFLLCNHSSGATFTKKSWEEISAENLNFDIFCQFFGVKGVGRGVKMKVLLLIGETTGYTDSKMGSIQLLVLNFGERSKLGGTRENWPKIGQNVKFPMGKQNFQKSSKC